MKQEPAPLARTAGLLLAAAALPFTPLLAQDVTEPPPADPTVIEAPPAPVTEAPPAVAEPAPLPEATAPPPAIETPAAAVEAAPPPARTRRTTTTTRTTVRAPAAVAAAPVLVTPAPVEGVPVTVAPLPPPVAQTPPPQILPEAVPIAPVEQDRASILPWLLAGLLLVGALAFFALRRRRTTAVYDEVREPALAPAVVPVVDAAPTGRPELALTMRPVRAGVTGEGARVEFELTVDNRGPVAAEDVRISTWMLGSGASEAERVLIEPRDHADTAPVTIGAGQARTMEASVALPASEVEGDAVLPVVVADARYRLPDGSEGRTSASFAVGVPDGEELAHFAVDNPSGLHDDVVARPLGEPERV
jgi:hypothetical protein